MIENNFGPEDIYIVISTVFNKYLKAHNLSVDRKKAKTICKAIIQLQSLNTPVFLLDRIRGCTFDTWNLYVNDKNVFCVSESKCGLTLRFFDDSDTDKWLDCFCNLASQHSKKYGRYT